MSHLNVNPKGKSSNIKNDIEKEFSLLIYAKPEKDLKKNFQIDITNELKKYARTIEETEDIDFIEASFLVENSTKIWARKVMFLYKLAIETSEFLGRDIPQSNNTSPSEPPKVRPHRKVVNPVRKEMEDFCSLDDLQPAKKGSLDLPEVQHMERNTFGYLRHSVALFDRKDSENRGLPLLDADGEPFGTFWDFAMTNNTFHSSGALLLPNFPKNCSFDTEESEKDTSLFTDDAPPVVTTPVDPWAALSGNGNQIDDEVNEAAVDIPSDEDADLLAEYLDLSGEPPAKRKVLRSNPNLSLTRFLEDKYFSDIYKEKIKACNRPRNHVFYGTARQAQLEKETLLKTRRKRRKRKLVSVDDEMSSSEGKRLHLQHSHRSACSPLFESSPNPDVAMIGQESREEMLLGIPRHDHNENPVNHSTGMCTAVSDTKSPWIVKPIGPFSSSTIAIDPIAGSAENQHLIQDEDGRQVQNSECPNGVNSPPQAISPVCAMDEDHLSEIEIPRSSPDPFETDDAPVSNQGLEIIPFHNTANNDATDGETLETTLKRKVNAYFEKAEEFAPKTELSVAVKKWEENIKSILEETKSREVFDFHEYKEKLMEHLEEGYQDSVMFKDLCRGKARWQICRYFLVSLQMANDYNIDINTSDDPCGTCTLSLTLMSPRRTGTDNAEDTGESMDTQ